MAQPRDAHEVTAELFARIREELPALVDPDRFDANRDPFDILETILRDQRPEGGRDAYTRILRRLPDDARAGETLPMPPWWVQVGDAGFRSNTVGVEARTVREACRLAMEKANTEPDGWENVGDPSDSFIDAVSAGRDVDSWQDGGWQNVPHEFTQDFVLGGERKRERLRHAGAPRRDRDARQRPDLDRSRARRCGINHKLRKLRHLWFIEGSRRLWLTHRAGQIRRQNRRATMQAPGTHTISVRAGPESSRSNGKPTKPTLAASASRAANG